MNQSNICHLSSKEQPRKSQLSVFFHSFYYMNKTPFLVHVSSVPTIWIQQKAIVYIQQVLLGDKEPNS